MSTNPFIPTAPPQAPSPNPFLQQASASAPANAPAATGNFAPGGPPVATGNAHNNTPPAGGYGDDPFGRPAPRLPRGPRVRDCAGRLVLIIPTAKERVWNTIDPQQPKQEDRLTCDWIVLDGGELEYGGRPEEGTPHTLRAAVPHKTPGMWVNASGIVAQCREALEANLAGANPPRMVLGRVVKGQASGNKKPPWLLEPATEADAHLARQYIQWAASQAIG